MKSVDLGILSKSECFSFVHEGNILAYSNKSITEISEEVGYDSVNAFIKIFKRKTNYPPNTYRKLQKNT